MSSNPYVINQVNSILKSIPSEVKVAAFLVFSYILIWLLTEPKNGGGQDEKNK